MKTIPRRWRALPPGAETAMEGYPLEPCSDAAAMVWLFPFGETAYDVARGSVSTIELCFRSQADARVFYERAVASGEVEKAELRFARAGAPRGTLIDEYDADAVCDEDEGEELRGLGAHRTSVPFDPDEDVLLADGAFARMRADGDVAIYDEDGNFLDLVRSFTEAREQYGEPRGVGGGVLAGLRGLWGR